MGLPHNWSSCRTTLFQDICRPIPSATTRNIGTARTGCIVQALIATKSIFVFPRRSSMLRKSELDPIMTGAYCEGQSRFGDLGLSFETYAGRIAAIVKKYLGSPSKDVAINFVK